MTSKKWFVILLSLTLAVVIVFGAMTYFLDPLLQYGNERGPLTSREYTEMYSNPGIAKNYDYNAVFVGSSMAENANVSELDELFGCKTIKVPYSGGSSYNHKHILDVCYNSGHKIDYVFWNLDENALIMDYMTPAYPLPEYLYDDDKTNDIEYIKNWIYRQMSLLNSLFKINNLYEYITLDITHVGPENYDNYLIVFDMISRKYMSRCFKKMMIHLGIYLVIALIIIGIILL